MSDEKIIHTFIVLAYKESEYLEESIKSVLNQEYPSKVIIGTSTDNEYIRSYAKKYNLEVVVNPVKGGGNTGDFDFAWSHGDNELVTIAHQDDVYDPGYSKAIVEAYKKYPNSEIIFTDYFEVRNGERVYKDTLLTVKRMILHKLKRLKSSSKISDKQSCLRWGCSIMCPSVAYVPHNIPYDKIFTQDEFVGVADWYGWYKLSKAENVAFTYIDTPLMGHRVHPGSHTSREINSDIRSGQELEMFEKFWPTWFAKFLNHFYRYAQKSNTLK